MTQVNRAQALNSKLALRKRAAHRSLASRRADFAAQMREMALSDLSQVSVRLKALHVEWERKDGRKWTHYELAQAMDIAPRTFQSWENGEVENRDGKGYDKMARFYSRKLGRKITRQWILFGDQVDAPDTSDLSDKLNQAEPASAAKLEKMLRQVLDQQATLLADVSEVRSEQERLSPLIERLARDPAAKRKGASSS